MSKTIAGTPFTVCYKTEVINIISGHHLYKKVWEAMIGGIFEAASDD